MVGKEKERGRERAKGKGKVAKRELLKVMSSYARCFS